MAKHLVLVVHGIGEQAPGETVGALTGAACSEATDDPVVQQSSITRLAEDGPETARDPGYFPCHTHRVHRTGHSEDDTLLAEVYWADLSPAPTGPIQTFIDLLRLILGLGFLARDNARNGQGPRDMRAVELVNMFTWLMWGPIAGLNFFLLIAAGVVLAMQAVGLVIPPVRDLPGELALVIISLVTIAIAWIIHKRGPTKALAILSHTLAAAALVTLGLVITHLFGAPYLDALTALVETQQTADLDNPLIGYAGVILLSLYFFWFTTIVVCIVILAYAVVVQIALKDRHNLIYPAICSAMLLFWFIFTSAFWVGFEALTKTLEFSATLQQIFEVHFSSATAPLSVSVIALMLVIAITIFALVRRQRGHDLRRIAHEDATPADRIILNGMVGASLVIAPLLLCFSSIAITYASLDLNPIATAGPLDWFLDFHKQAYPVALAGLLLLGGMLYRNHAVVATGLGIFRDIIVYARLGRDPAHRHPERTRIEARFAAVMRHMIAAETPERVTVISHSQGTVVALRNLIGPSAPAGLTGERAVNLVTMGCPYTHLYRTYFPGSYPGDNIAGTVVARWTNIYRLDDFVGTTVDGIADVENLPVRAAGHTGYWSDRDVWTHLNADERFKLF